VRLGRQFVGVDLDQHYCQIAHDRVASECSEIPLGAPVTPL
jgi:DNA modification methylase